MRRTRNRNRHYNYPRNEARRSRPEWREDEHTGMDRRSDGLRDDRFSHGYHNSDYNRKNFWSGNSAYEDRRGWNEPTGFMESERPRNRNGYKRRKTSGYGNENSRFAEDFERMRGNHYYDNDRYQRSEEPQNNYYGDKYYYNPSNYDRGGYRKNYELTPRQVRNNPRITTDP
jgi:hypothetical protein